MKFILSLLLCVSVAACGRSTGSNSPPTDQAPGQPTPSPAPKDPEAFVRQFFFLASSKCGSPLPHYYHFAESRAVKIARNRKGQDVLAEIALLIYPDHTYKAAYDEVDVTEYTKDGYFWKDSRTQEIDGIWRVKDGQLELSGLGFAAPVDGQPFPMLLLKLNYDLITAGLSLHLLPIYRVEADYLPIPSADPCHVEPSATAVEPEQN